MIPWKLIWLFTCHPLDFLVVIMRLDIQQIWWGILECITLMLVVENIYIYTLYITKLSIYIFITWIYMICWITHEYLSNSKFEVCNYSNGIFLIVHLQFAFVYTVDLSTFVLPTIKWWCLSHKYRYNKSRQCGWNIEGDLSFQTGDPIASFMAPVLSVTVQ